ncbi:type II secretion system protein GspD [Deinococcus sp. 23YEL01]|uniref:type II secretion system protein GspD n=1 Tax=Deinococcus sp. 23YEL01 TaxID=2745871 RepID=UPI001E62527D|nr:secretin N-terminal domain-containing protein [Deinococcus sp. 23YEL01]MCD0168224.1 pilus assembly protein PilQ [Deinococcus sp. 23YEL01]
MNRMLTLMLALSSASLTAYAATPAAVTATPALAVTLPSNPKLVKTVTVTLPSGAPLSTVLTAIAKATGLTLLSRDIPNVPVTLSIKGLTGKAALERLLSLYSDRVAAQLIGDTLVIAPPGAINALLTAPKPVLVTVPVLLTADDAARLATLTGTTIVPVGEASIISGTAEQVAQVQALLTTQVSTPAASGTITDSVPMTRTDPDLARTTLAALHDVKLFAAYGRAYLQAPSAAALTAAKITLAQLEKDAPDRPVAGSDQDPVPLALPPADVQQQRTIQTSLGADLVTRIAASVSSTLKPTPLDAGTYVLRGPADDLTAFQAALSAAEVREAMRVIVVYPDVSSGTDAPLKEIFPNASVRVVSGGLEVRATPVEQVRVSAYLQQVRLGAATPAPTMEDVTLRVSLAYATPATLVQQLGTLYVQEGTKAEGGEKAATSTTAQGTGSTTASTTQGGTPSTSQSGGQSAGATLIGGVRVVADDRTRSVVLTGNPDAVARVKRTIQDLDARLPDVRMALRIEQISGSNGSDLGLDWKVGVGGFSIGHTDGALTAGYAAGLSPVSVEAKLQAARTSGRANTLLDTSFVAQDGRPSVFRNGGQLLLPVTNTSTGGGTSTTTQTRETYDYGLNVTLTPRLSPDGRVELQIQLDLGQTPRAGVQNSILVEKQTLTTIATVTPGETLLLGGVLSTDDSATKKGVPILSEIPVLGALFGKTSVTKGTSVLLISLQAADRSDTRGPAVPTVTPGAGVTQIKIPGR